MGRRKGFTLIELLVVIAIIAILAAILFPVFIAAKGRAQQGACIAHMKQFGIALSSYMGSWNDTYPPNRFQDPLMAVNQKMDGSRYNWKSALQTAMKTKGDVWCCQTNPNNNFYDETGDAVDPQSVTQKFFISYAYNGDFFNKFPYSGSYSCIVRKLSDIPTPTKLLLIMESIMKEPDIQCEFATQAWADSTYTATGKKVTGCRFTIHTGKVTNVMFCDGHAKAAKLKSLYTPKQMWSINDPLRDQNYYDGVADKICSQAE